MRSVILSLAGLIACGSMACVAPEGPVAAGDEPAVEQQQDALSIATSDYFIVTRPDYRRCAYPMCGGWFVKRVNRPTTRCVDGTMQSECHAVDLDLSAVAVGDEDRAKFRDTFGRGFGLVRGELTAVSGPSGRADTMVVSDAWVGQAASSPAGDFYAVSGTGVRCLAAPCPTYTESRLNRRNRRNLAEVDLAASGATERQVEAGYEELWASGILVAGSHTVVTGPAGRMPALVASEFYLRLKPSTLGQACGGIAGLACAPAEVCDIDIPGACSGADLSGVCKTVPELCTEEYAPVCGCDGVTYSNDCHRLSAGAQLDHQGECAVR